VVVASDPFLPNDESCLGQSKIGVTFVSSLTQQPPSSWRPGAIRRRHRAIIRYPPSEQSCAGVEAGAGWSIVVVRCWGRCGACFGELGG
jgi:hypothetical protein